MSSPTEPPRETQREHVRRLLSEGRIDSNITAELAGLQDSSLVHAVVEAEIASVDRLYADYFRAILNPARRVAWAIGFRGTIVDLVLDALIAFEIDEGTMPRFGVVTDSLRSSASEATVAS